MSVTSSVCHPEDNTTREIVLHQLMQPSPPSGVGREYYTCPMGVSKDRRVVRLQSRHQNFYSRDGRVRLANAHARTHHTHTHTSRRLANVF
jgi:hypothetical protein